MSDEADEVEAAAAVEGLLVEARAGLPDDVLGTGVYSESLRSSGGSILGRIDDDDVDGG